MVKWFCAKVFSMMDHFIMMDRSRDQSTIEKTFAQNHFTMIDRSRDLSTMEKTFAQGKIMHLQRIFQYDYFINAAIREWVYFGE